MRVVDGFQVEYPYRNSWKVDRYRLGKFVDTIPVVWDDDVKFSERLLIVLYQDADECQKTIDYNLEFAITVAKPKDYKARIRSADKFQCVYEVRPTGRRGMSRDLEGIECQILRKIVGEHSFEF